MEMDQMEVLCPNEMETEPNLWTSSSAFPSERERTIGGHLRVCKSMLQKGIWCSLPLIVAILT